MYGWAVLARASMLLHILLCYIIYYVCIYMQLQLGDYAQWIMWCFVWFGSVQVCPQENSILISISISISISS